MKDPEMSICCGRGKCPVVSLDKEHAFVEVTDDFGGSIKIPVDQAPKVSAALTTVSLAAGVKE